MSKWRNATEPDFPLRGPKALTEWFESLRAAGQTLLQHHLDLVKKSGIPEKGGLAREHFALTEALWNFVSWDQVDCSMLIGCEFMARRIIVLETAIARNPKNPDYEGLDVIMSSRITETGTASTVEFQKWISNVHKDEPQIMKQGRLLREEKAAAAKVKPGKPGETPP